MKKKILAFITSVILAANAFTFYEDRLENIEFILDNDVYLSDEPPRILSQQEFMDDLKDFGYIFDEGYIFIDDAYSHGWNSYDFVIQGFNYFLKQNNTSKDLFAYINLNISQCVDDMHLQSYLDKSLFFSNPKIICFSDTYVKKIFGKYKVISSDNFEPGTKLKVRKENVFPVIYKGKKRFRIGSLCDFHDLYKSYSFEYNTYQKLTTSVNVKIKNTSHYIPCTTTDNTYTNEEFHYIDSDDFIYMNIPNCSPESEFFKTMNNLAEKCFNKKNVIIDIRSNGGGNIHFWTNFLYKLYTGNTSCTTEEIEKNFIKYIIPTCYERDSNLIKKYWTEYYEKNSNINNESDNIQNLYSSEKLNQNKIKFNCKFKGKIFILMNKNSASSAELFVHNAKKLFKKQCITVGSNSLGGLKSVNPISYRLKNSGLCLSIPSCTFDETFFEEGTGLLPDYWIDTAGMDMTLQALTGYNDLTVEQF